MGVRTLEAWSRRLKPGAGTVPTLWLLSDPHRLPDPRPAAARLPRGAAVLARGATPSVLAGLALLCRRRGLVLLVGGDGAAALRHRAGLHLPDRAVATRLLPFLLARRRRRVARPILSAAAHGRAGLVRARRLGADAVLLSPAFPTASHPGAPAMGPLRWAALASLAGRAAIALGGVSAETAGRLPRRGHGRAAGLAAIGALAAK